MFPSLIFSLQGVCSQLEHSVVSLVTSPGLEEAATDLATSLLNRSDHTFLNRYFDRKFRIFKRRSFIEVQEATVLVDCANLC